VEIDVGSQKKEILCFNRKWYQEGTIAFQKNNVDVTLGLDRTVRFDVINVRDRKRTFEISMVPGSSIYTYSSFVDKEGDSFQTSIEPVQEIKKIKNCDVIVNT
jgi:hypothetical protein